MPSSCLILPIICPSAHHSLPAHPSIQSIFIHYPAFPTFLMPGPCMGLCGFQLLPDVSLILGAGKQLLPLMCVHLFPELQGFWAVMWAVGHGQIPECPVQLHNVTHSVLSWSALLGLAGTAGPSTQDSIPISAALFRSGGNISCQDLSSPGCSSESEMAAADAHFFSPPVAYWQVLPAALHAARHACSKTSSPGGAGGG